MPKARGVYAGGVKLLGFMIFCPACECGHCFYTECDDKPKWTFDGNLEEPTFHPSMLVRGKRHITDEEAARIMAGEKLDIPDQCCHSFVRDGKIQFLVDCTHKLAGQTVELPQI